MIIALIFWTAIILCATVVITLRVEGEDVMGLPYLWVVAFIAAATPWAVFGIAKIVEAML